MGGPTVERRGRRRWAAKGLDAQDRRIIALAVPALGTLVAEPLYNLTDTAIVGHLGRSPLGGLAVATAILNLVVYGCGFLAMVTTPRVAFLRSRGEPEAAARAAGSAYAMAFGLGVVLAAAVEIAARPLAELAGARGPVLVQAVTYLHTAVYGLPFVLCMLAGSGHVRGLSDTRTPFVVALSSNAVNLVLEVVLVFGLSTGVRGSALGTVIAQAMGGAWFVVISLRRAPSRSSLRPGWIDMARLARVGAVLVVRTLALLAALSGSTAVSARLGAVRLGGHQIALQLWSLIALSLDALAVPAQILVAEALGSGGAEAARRVGAQVLRWGAVVGACLGVVTVALSGVLPDMFSTDGAIRHQATVGLLFVGASLPLAAVAFELDGVLIGAGDVAFLRRAMLAALAGFAPLAAATLMWHSLGIAGVWGALLCWMAVRAALLARRWRSGRWLELGDGHDQRRPGLREGAQPGGSVGVIVLGPS
jgi:putative MATE family efflux protein